MPFLDSGFRPVESFQERSRIIDSAVPEREHVGIVVVDNYLRYFVVLQQTQSDTGTPGIGFDIRDVTNAENIDKRGDVPGQHAFAAGISQRRSHIVVGDERDGQAPRLRDCKH